MLNSSPTPLGAGIEIFEALAEESLKKLDAKTGHECVEWLKHDHPFPSGYYTAFIFQTAHEYACVLAAKKRFACLPTLLKRLRPSSSEYKAFANNLERTAKGLKCDPHRLEAEAEWSDFKW